MHNNDHLFPSITEEDWAGMTAMMDELAREDEENPPDLSLEAEVDIEGLRYSARLQVYRGEGDDPDEHHFESEFGDWCVTPPLPKGRGEDELRAWTIQNLHDLREQDTPRGQARMQIWAIIRASGLVDNAPAEALARRIVDGVVLPKPRIGVRAATEALATSA